MKRRYLLVDDNHAFAENVAEILSDAGAEVTCAADGEGALEAVSKSRFDAMVTDMKMPGVSGSELLRRVRERDPGLPVVLVSAYTRNEQLAEARQLGLLAFFAKTSGPAELLALLSHARRDAMVLAATEDEARVEQVRETLSRLGITVCSGSGEVPPICKPRAILADGESRWASLFPSVPVFSLRDPVETIGTRLDSLCAASAA
ncbi:MAG: response regulator [Archangium sp.]|nr:response regulator [Archangium sp.]